MEKKKVINVIIEVSARHVHLFQEQIEKLFGRGYKLTVFKQLSQRGEFASNEVVDLKTAKNTLKHVRVLGPARNYTQVELSKTDAFYLGMDALVKVSGDLDGTPGLTIAGSKGKIDIPQGVIFSYRHIHCSPIQARKYGLKHGQLVKVKIVGQRGLVFNNVMIKVKKGFNWRMHIDTDEANAAGIDDSNNIGEVLIT